MLNIFSKARILFDLFFFFFSDTSLYLEVLPTLLKTNFTIQGRLIRVMWFIKWIYRSFIYTFFDPSSLSLKQQIPSRKYKLKVWKYWYNTATTTTTTITHCIIIGHIKFNQKKKTKKVFKINWNQASQTKILQWEIKRKQKKNNY